MPFVYNSWLNHNKFDPRYFGIRRSIFFNYREPMIKDIVARAGILVACPPTSPNTILGFVCAETFVLEGDIEAVIHFMYVKKEFRRFGIASMLYEEATKATDKDPWSTTTLANAWKFEGRTEVVAANSRKPLTRVYHNPVVVVRGLTTLENSFRSIYNPFLEEQLKTLDTKPIEEMNNGE